MREVGLFDVCTAILAAAVGVICLFESGMLWKLRNGSLLIKSLCLQLASFGLWGVLVFSSVLYEWQEHVATPTIGLNIRLIDRLVLCIPQAYIILFVIPKAKH